jgi:small conductance mechanosensitive channel
MDAFINQAMSLLAAYAPKVLLAIGVLVVGFWATNRIVGVIDKRLEKRGFDPSLRPFLKSLAGVLLKMAILISVATMVGVETTSFVAVLGAAGLAIGLALQGSLGNFAGGVLILMFKPIKVGDFVEAQGHAGIVSEIQIFQTVLKTPDNRTIFIPNGPLSNGSLVNFSTEDIRRVDMVFGVGYGDDLGKVRSTLEEIVKADTRILAEPGADILVGALADSSVNFNVRVWGKKEDYWGIFFDMHENVKKTFDAKNISIPFPQMDVHKG